MFTLGTLGHYDPTFANPKTADPNSTLPYAPTKGILSFLLLNVSNDKVYFQPTNLVTSLENTERLMAPLTEE